MNIQDAIRLAIEKGGYENSATAKPYIYYAYPLDPAFWTSLGKALGWGAWTKSLADIEHDWELTHYLADTAKTPVYDCKKCGARKTNNLIVIESEYEWLELDNPRYTFTHSYVLKRHGAQYLDDWKAHALRYFEMKLTQPEKEEEFWNNLLEKGV